MSVSIVKKNGYPVDTNLSTYVIDSESDVSTLPTDAGDGSIAYMPDLTKVYILKSGSWTAVDGDVSISICI